MAHIPLPDGLPGILGPLAQYPETGNVLRQLTHLLLRGPNTLTEGERELIAAYVSSENECFFCASSHAAAAKHLLGDDDLVEGVLEGYHFSNVSDKMKGLLNIAGKVRKGGLHVKEFDVAVAREVGATDKEIHDTVLIAAAFSMFNRYVDGLATLTPRETEAYAQMGARLAHHGYNNPVPAEEADAAH